MQIFQASASPRSQLGGATRPNSIAIMGTIAELESVNISGHSRSNTHSIQDLASEAAKPKAFDMRQLRTSLSLQVIRQNMECVLAR